MGRLSPTKYYLSNLQTTLTIIRRHHPLEGQELDLLSATKNWAVVRLPDGSSLKILRVWTDADTTTCMELTGNSQLCLSGLRELLKQFEALRKRRLFESNVVGDKMNSSHDSIGDGDAQAEVVGVHRDRAVGQALGDVSRVSETRSDTALCPVDGTPVGATDSGIEKEAGGGR